MEGLDCLFGALEQFLELFLFLIHFLFVLLFLPINFLQPLGNHVVDISGLLINNPSVLYLFWLKFVFVLLEQGINIGIFKKFNFDFLNLQRSRSVQVIFQLASFFYCVRILLDFVLNVCEHLQLLSCRLGHSVRNHFLKTHCDLAVLCGEEITNLFSFDLKHSHLYFLDNLSFYLFLSFPVKLDLVFDFFDLFVFVVFNFFEFISNIEE